MKGTTAAQKALNPREAKNLCELSQAESRHYSIHFSKKERRLYGEKSYEVKPAQLSRGKGRLEPRRKKSQKKSITLVILCKMVILIISTIHSMCMQISTRNRSSEFLRVWSLRFEPLNYPRNQDIRPDLFR